jgi:hypothetical protein
MGWEAMAHLDPSFIHDAGERKVRMLKQRCPDMEDRLVAMGATR